MRQNHYFILIPVSTFFPQNPTTAAKITTPEITWELRAEHKLMFAQPRAALKTPVNLALSFNLRSIYYDLGFVTLSSLRCYYLLNFVPEQTLAFARRGVWRRLIIWYLLFNKYSLGELRDFQGSSLKVCVSVAFNKPLVLPHVGTFRFCFWKKRDLLYNHLTGKNIIVSSMAWNLVWDGFGWNQYYYRCLIFFCFQSLWETTKRTRTTKWLKSNR